MGDVPRRTVVFVVLFMRDVPWRVCTLFKYKNIFVSKVVVARCYHLFALPKSFYYFVVLRVLSSYFYFAFVGFIATWVKDINPFATGMLEARSG